MELGVERLGNCGLDEHEAAAFRKQLRQALQGAADTEDSAQVWRRISKFVLRPDQPFALHKLLFDATYQGWDAAVLGPPPAWVPTPCGMAATNAARFMSSWPGDETWRQLRSGDPGADWDLLQRISFSHPEAFWPHLLKLMGIRFRRQPTRVLSSDPDPDNCCWLPNARFNIAECALTGRDPDRPAIVWADEATPHVLHSMSLGQLATRSAHVAAALRSMGLKPGDAVAIDMPLTADAVAIYLGIVLAGCAVVSIADSFVAAEIASRCGIAHTKAIFTQDVILRGGKALPLYKRVAEAGVPRAIVLPALPGGRLQAQLRPEDLSWDGFLAAVQQPTCVASLAAHAASAEETTNILFSSGTTGDPKAIPWTHVTPLRCGADAFFHQDVRPGDAVCWPTNMGWMMGPWLVYAALLNSATIAIFQGSPLGRPFGKFVEQARVTTLGLVPSIFKAWRATDCMKGLDWSCLRCYSSTGEASAPEDVLWLMARGGYKPVIEYCGGTELGGAYFTNSPLQPQAPSTFSTPTIGHCPVIMTQQPDGSSILSFHGDGTAVTGELALAVPCLGVSQRLLNKDHRQAYYEGMPEGSGGRWFLRRHGDEMERLPGGAYRALGRVDDTMNLGGIKVSSVELERVCVAHLDGVLEAAAVAAPTPGGGPEQLFLFLVLRPGSTALAADLQQRCQAAISSQLNPLFRVHKALLRSSLPRNASNKVMRRELRADLMRSQSKL
ncbi:hypothetical protein D9Q98_002006 [Chlorella vulgaris]|uniref:Uncharacterized protein n=1 Tax=Chlorella vulgaris TaxID=3077 RepID=A0A9D4TVK9_CHLVU|nr:hypothetical protein D9Q98_002006 [Chlorella vulgaris]